jgi:hypothetical protein
MNTSGLALLAACAVACSRQTASSPALALEPESSRAVQLDPSLTMLSSAAVSSTRCERAGGKCIGPVELRGRPKDPCPSGMYRIDYMNAYEGQGEARRVAACPAVPTGEETCCLWEP